MTTANDIVSGALRKLGVRASETAIEDYEGQDGLEDLNDLAAENHLFPPVASLSDTINVPREMVGALKLVLAEKLMPDYPNIQLTPALNKQFLEAWDAIWRAKNGKLDVKFPNTVPRGTGNQGSPYVWDNAFMDGQETNF